MSSQSYGDATQLAPGHNIALADAIVSLAATAEPTIVEVYAGFDGLGITSCGVQIVAAAVGSDAVIELQRRPIAGVEANEVPIGTITVGLTVGNAATPGDVIKTVFEGFAENASGVPEIGIPPGQSFVMAVTTAVGTSCTVIPIVNGYRYPSGSLKVATLGENLPLPSTSTLFNVNITAS